MKTAWSSKQTDDGGGVEQGQKQTMVEERTETAMKQQRDV